MSWKLGRKSPKSSKSQLSVDDAAPRPVTPTPGNLNGPQLQGGLLTIHIMSAENMALPAGSGLPSAVKSALKSAEAQAASSVSPSSVLQQRRNNRDSMQRVQCWWLPYIVLEFDVNQVLITPLGGDISSPVYMFRAHFDLSRPSELSLQFYLRAERPKRGSEGDDIGDDVFLGGIAFAPDFNNLTCQPEWYNLSGGSGRVQLGMSFQSNVCQSLSVDSFDLLKVIGKGSFGKVMQVRKRDTNRIYAMKTLRKELIISRNEIQHTLAERLVLGRVNCPFIVPLKFSFQTEHKLYLVLAFVNGGELFYHLKKEQTFDEERSRFYSAELLLALEHLHDLDVIYRDLKPENILVDYTGHIALCDFGLCKMNMKDKDRTHTFCGTPEYIAPEILVAGSGGYNRTVDWWTLGVLLYEMMCGLPPFFDESAPAMYTKILNDPLVFPEYVGSDARNILVGLVERDPAKRLGANGADEIKRHPFFNKHIDFKRLLRKKIQPPFKPEVQSVVDVSNFDTEFTAEAALDSVVEGNKLSKTLQEQFAGFSYDGSHLPASPSPRSE